MSGNENNEGQAADQSLGLIDRLVLFVALWIGGPVLGFMVILTVVDVTLRYVFNSPIFGAEDFSSLSLSVAVSAAIAYSGRTGGQVSVELFVNFMSPNITRVTDFIVRILSIAMLLVLSWRLIHSGIDAAEFGETSFALLIPFEPFFYILAAGMFLYALVLAAEMLFHYRGDGPDQISDL